MLRAGASFGLESDKKVLKTARWGTASVEVPPVRCKTRKTPRGAQAPFSSQSNSILGDQASDATSVCLPICTGRASCRSSVTGGLGWHHRLKGLSMLVPLKLHLLCSHVSVSCPWCALPQWIVSCLPFCSCSFLDASLEQLACLTRLQCHPHWNPETCPPTLLTNPLFLSSCTSSARFPSPRSPIDLRLFR